MKTSDADAASAHVAFTALARWAWRGFAASALAMRRRKVSEHREDGAPPTSRHEARPPSVSVASSPTSFRITKRATSRSLTLTCVQGHCRPHASTRRTSVRSVRPSIAVACGPCSAEAGSTDGAPAPTVTLYRGREEALRAGASMPHMARGCCFCQSATTTTTCHQGQARVNGFGRELERRASCTQRVSHTQAH